jgi:hypothetical protein
MKATPLYYPLDQHREIEITMRLREYNGIDNDPAVITREPTLSEAVELAGKLPEHVFMRLATESTLSDVDAAPASPAAESEAHFILRALACIMNGEPAWESLWMNYPHKPAKTPADVVREYLKEHAPAAAVSPLDWKEEHQPLHP